MPLHPEASARAAVCPRACSAAATCCRALSTSAAIACRSPLMMSVSDINLLSAAATDSDALFRRRRARMIGGRSGCRGLVALSRPEVRLRPARGVGGSLAWLFAALTSWRSGQHAVLARRDAGATVGSLSGLRRRSRAPLACFELDAVLGEVVDQVIEGAAGPQLLRSGWSHGRARRPLPEPQRAPGSRASPSCLDPTSNPLASAACSETSSANPKVSAPVRLL